MKNLIVFTLLGLAVFFVGKQFWPEEKRIDFNTQVKPILNKNCISCHGGVKKQGGFSLLFREEALGKTKFNKAAIVPGHPEKSSFIQRLTLQDPEEKMPYKRPPLSQKEIQILSQWVKEGAVWGEHWAYQPLKKVNVPYSSWWKKAFSWLGLPIGWEQNEIDHFVAAKQAEMGLGHQSKAKNADLLRRLYLDLTGLSPTEAEYKAFESDHSDNAYEKKVDELLQSPQFGEKWASMWMDLARYADTKGYEKDDKRSIWRYRDYVIASFNQNKPYDQFITEQLAGDLLPNPNESQYIATAFHRNTANNDEGGTEDEEFRVAAIIDRVNTTWETLQGTSFSCVQCHSHPYDPIRHEEYYRYMAYFNNTRDEDVPDESPYYRHFKSTDQARVDSLLNVIKTTYPQDYQHWKNSIQFVEPKIHPHWADEFVNGALQDNKYLAVRPGGSVRFKAVPMNGKTEMLIAYKNTNDSPTQLIIRQGSLQGKIVAQIKLDTTLPEKEGIKKGNWAHGWTYAFYRIPALAGKQDLFWSFQNKSCQPEQNTAVIGYWMLLPNVPKPLQSSSFLSVAKRLISTQPEGTTPILLENPSEFERATPLFERGSWLNPGKQVDRSIPQLFAKYYNKPIRNRLQLAQWMGSPQNPLTSRVAVNRIWEQLFGTGLVETLEDLGSQGLSPSHQELLDYLAYQFQFKFDFKPKDFIKYVVMSATYQQSSEYTQESKEKDPNNRYLSHGPRVRLSPEQIRDQALRWSGLLSSKVGGPSVMPEQPEGIWNAPYSGMKWNKSDGEDQWRRSLYTYWRRSSPYPTQVTFDAGTRDICLSRRIRTNTPMQALNTLNDPVFLECAQFFARKYPLDKEDVFIEKAYFQLFGKEISSTKKKSLLNFYRQVLPIYQKNQQKCREFLQLCPDNTLPAAAPNLIARTLVSNVLFNLDETVNKP
ncbi:PSD1 and planctomycete cytochrome C domain-containing protein [Aquirufa rosea]|uniref:DUF1553 domain-containing protein n=1 Tax=Aquirufa rosea TaxID=2509241 RepID=A0A4Q1BXC4_9BACT|nr:PSD1 and planctomycete cytochrome C domain-containing protein [Aquirufa rosea]RXK46856.1 DUF1553 domain-containing protein [Aquirufa rosea]